MYCALACLLVERRRITPQSTRSSSWRARLSDRFEERLLLLYLGEEDLREPVLISEKPSERFDVCFLAGRCVEVLPGSLKTE